MRNLLRTMAGRLEAGEDLALVTVVASSGATPRGTGARMLVGSGGRICGTIGGGAVEYRAEQMALDVLRTRTSMERSFNLTKDDVQKLGMVCGGEVSVFFRHIPSEDAECRAFCQNAESLFANGNELWLLYELTGGGMGLFAPGEGFFGINPPEGVIADLSREAGRVQSGGGDYYIEQINAPGKVYIFGCGHVAQELAPALAKVGFRCVACDDRPEFASHALFPTAEGVMLIDFTRIADFINITKHDYVCIMTRGHAFDTTVQAQILTTQACYIGVIGSAAKKAHVFSELHAGGFTPADTDRIVTPIGLKILAETPAEIAVSITAQMIQARATLRTQPRS